MNSVRNVEASPGRTGALSVHFRAAEFQCRHCYAAIVRPELVELLERIRSRIGRPLPIVSGYRCPLHNAHVGGAADSQHMYGTAADLPLRLVPPAIAATAGARGIGIKDGFAIHVDVRPGPRARWTYK